MTFHTETGSSRYEALREIIADEFGRSRTLSPALAAGEQKTLINANDHDDTYAVPEHFEKFAPFNTITVMNYSTTSDIRIYLNESRNLFIDVAQDSPSGVAAIQKVPHRYIDYLRIENLSGTDAISEGEVLIQVGNEVDSEELTLLEMSGELNV